TVTLALKTLRELGLIVIDDDTFIRISNWEKHQNVEGMDRVRKLNAERNKRYRERKKQQQLLESKTNDVSMTSPYGTVEELEKDIEIEQERDKDVAKIIQFWDKNGFGVNNIHAKKQLLLWLDDSSFKDPSEVILKALNIACENDARRLKYAEGILKNWENESLLTVEEIENSHKKRNQQAVSQIDYDPNRDRF